MSNKMKKFRIIALALLIIFISGCTSGIHVKIGQGQDKLEYPNDAESLLRNPDLDADIREILEQVSYTEILDNSFDKINKDLAAGAISREEAVRMTLFAALGGERLPDGYKGEPVRSNVSINPELLWISNNLESLDQESREFFEPYILRPDDPRSYFYPAQHQKQSGLQDGAHDRPVAGLLDRLLDGLGGLLERLLFSTVYAAEADIVFDSVEYNPGTAPGARVHYVVTSDLDDFEKQLNKEQAEAVVKVLKKAWPKFKQLLGEGEPEKMIDIYFVDNLPAYGSASWNGSERKAHINIKSNLSGKPMEATVAHELFHVFQFHMGLTFYDIDKDLLWLVEATAVWSEHFIFPDYNTEFEYNDYFFKSLYRDFVAANGEHEYSRYMFFRFLSQYMGSDEYVPKLLKAVKSGDIRKNVMEWIPNYGDVFSEFALYNWNHDPWLMYRDTPSFPSVMPSGFALWVSEIAKVAADDEWNCILDKGATQYHMFNFTASPDEIRRVKFDFKTKSEGPYLRRKALVKIGDVWELEPWNEITSREFCRNKPEENVKSVILILSNADLQNGGNIPYTVETRGECPKTIMGYTKITEKLTITGSKSVMAELISNDTIEYNLEEEAYMITKRNLTFKLTDSTDLLMPDGKKVNSLRTGSGSLIETYDIEDAPIKIVLYEDRKGGYLLINPDTIDTGWVTFNHSMTGTEPYTEKGTAGFLFVDARYELKESDITDTSVKGEYVWRGDSSAGYVEVIVEFGYDLP